MMRKALFIVAVMPFLASSAWSAEVTPTEQFTPALIPHPVATYLPITAEKNMCIMCHQPGVQGQKKVAGVPSAQPPSHVLNGKVAPNRYDCMLCHAEKK